MTTAPPPDEFRNADEASNDPPAPAKSRVDDTVTAVVVFGILGGLGALWAADLCVTTGTLAALISGLAGAVFADL